MKRDVEYVLTGKAEPVRFRFVADEEAALVIEQGADVIVIDREDVDDFVEKLKNFVQGLHY